MRTVFFIAPLLLLSACGSSKDEGGAGTSVNIDAKGESGEDVAIRADGDTGAVTMKVPGFEGKFALPKMHIGGDNFDIDGVTLYPGSKVTTFNVAATNSEKDGPTNVSIAFTSPADPSKVAAYFRKAFKDESIDLSGIDSALTGKNKDGDNFIITLAPGSAGQTNGKIALSAT
jgi:hypothetical protein